MASWNIHQGSGFFLGEQIFRTQQDRFFCELRRFGLEKLPAWKQAKEVVEFA